MAVDLVQHLVVRFACVRRQLPGPFADLLGKPTYTRPQIQQFYDRHRKGGYAGREAEWARQKADIIAAGREGRIQAPAYITK